MTYDKKPMTNNNKTKDSKISQPKVLGSKFSVARYKFFVISFLLLVLSFLFIAPHGANAGTILKSPAYLGLNQGLVGCWNFDGAYTKAQDCSGNNNTGTLENPTTMKRVPGKVGQGLNFNGVSHYVNLGDPSILIPGNTITLSAWFYMTNRTNTQFILAKDDGSAPTNETELRVQAGGPTMCRIGGTSVTGSTVTLNTWYHFTCTYDGSNVTSYLNGVFDISGAKTGAIADETGINWLIGARRPSSPVFFFEGIIDDVRIYNRGLSAQEVQRLYRVGLGSTANRTPTALDKSLVGYWTLDAKDIYGTSARDISGQGNHGTILNLARKDVGKIGQAMTFNIRDCIQIPAASSINDLGPMTASFWYKTTDTLGNQILLAKRTSSNTGRWWLEMGNNTRKFTFTKVGTTNLNRNSADNTAIYGEWANFVLTWDGSTTATNVRMYLNGAELTYGTGQNGETLGSDVTNNFVIGNLDSGSNTCTAGITGSMDDVRLYNRVLTAPEIRNLYQEAQSKYNSSRTDVLTNGLIGHWTFDGADIGSRGTIAKDKTGNNHGTITGATRAVGKIGQALSFNSNSDSVSLGVNKLSPLLNGASAITGSAWIYTRAHPSSGRARYIFASIEDAGVTGFSISDDGTNFEILARSKSTDGGQTLTVAHPALNEWHHVVGVVNFANATESIYIDGVLVAGPTAKTFGSTTYVNAAPSTPDLVGAVGSAAPSYRGSVDDVRLYRRALSASEIQNLYNEGR